MNIGFGIQIGEAAESFPGEGKDAFHQTVLSGALHTGTYRSGCLDQRADFGPGKTHFIYEAQNTVRCNHRHTGGNSLCGALIDGEDGHIIDAFVAGDGGVSKGKIGVRPLHLQKLGEPLVSHLRFLCDVNPVAEIRQLCFQTGVFGYQLIKFREVGGIAVQCIRYVVESLLQGGHQDIHRPAEGIGQSECGENGGHRHKNQRDYRDHHKKAAL